MKKFSKKMEDGSFKCTLCYHQCILKIGQQGKCLARKATRNGIELSSYGCLTSIIAEPIEKKPVYHYKPVSKTLSIGSYGCSFQCDYCQNHNISQQNKDYKKRRFSSSGVINLALTKKCQGICMTFNEPTIQYEYLIDVAEKCHKNDLFFAIKTNAFLNQEAWKDICEVTDVMNIDYKGNALTLPSRANIDKESVFHIMANIAYAIRHLHVEISIPIFRDTTEKDLVSFRHFIDELNPSIPIHLVKVFPANRYKERPISDELMVGLRKYLLESLDYVYLSNVFSEEGRKGKCTICPKCGKIIAFRNNLVTNLISEGCCAYCKNIFK